MDEPPFRCCSLCPQRVGFGPFCRRRYMSAPGMAVRTVSFCGAVDGDTLRACNRLRAWAAGMQLCRYVRGAVVRARPLLNFQGFLCSNFSPSLSSALERMLKMELMGERLSASCGHCWMSRCVRFARSGVAAGMVVRPALRCALCARCVSSCILTVQ